MQICVLQSGMAQLTLNFLGTFQVHLGSRPITKFRSANVQGLLVYLALHPGRAISRDVLAALFWPDEPDSTARSNFRQTLYQLRKLLGRGEDDERPFLLITRHSVQFNPESTYHCDVNEFLQALKLGDLATAEKLYTDDLLPGFACDSLEYEAWLRRERERLHGLALDALWQRTDWLLRGGKLMEARELAQRQLALEPWRELAHRQLMQAYAQAGDRQAAQAQFATCKLVLWEELAAEPEPETIALAEKIAAGEEIYLRSQPRHNLIAPVTAFFGREADLAAVQTHITSQATRLVTLVGEGGIGKSRLALEAAWQLRNLFADGVWFVPLAGVELAGGWRKEQAAAENLPQAGHTPPRAKKLEDAIATAVSQVLNHPMAGASSPRAQLLAILQEQNLLLILDNFEPLLAGAEFVLDLLHSAPNVCIICTSREPLNFQAEWVLPLERLPLPPVADPFLNTTAVPQEPTTYPAVQLFVDRAQRANGRFALTNENKTEVVTLCRLLSGLPLALELAAASLRRQTVTELITAVQNSIDALAVQRRDIPPRHRSMRAVFDSSWNLLSPEEKAQLASLSVFWGPFSQRSAAAVAEATLHQLQSLQEKSLLQIQGERFDFHALLRQFAAEKLAEYPEGDKAVVRHSHYYLQAVADLGGALNGEMPHLAVQRIAGAWENVKGAWETAVARSDLDHLLAALIPLSDFCQIRGFYGEGLTLFAQVAAGVSAAQQPEALAQLLTQQAAMHVRLSQYPQAIKLIEQALPLTADAWLKARLQITWGETLWRQGSLAEAEPKLHDALAIAQEVGGQHLIGIATYHLGVLHDLKGDYPASLAYLEAALATWQKLGNRRWQGFTLNSVGLVAQRLSRLERAETALQEALLISQANDDRQGQASALNNLSLLATNLGDFVSARRYLMQALTLARSSGDEERQARLHYNLAWNAKQAESWDDAFDFAKQSLALYRFIGNKREEHKVLRVLGEVAMENGRFEAAFDYFQQSLDLSQQIGDLASGQLVREAVEKLTEAQNKKGRE